MIVGCQQLGAVGSERRHQLFACLVEKAQVRAMLDLWDRRADYAEKPIGPAGAPTGRPDDQRQIEIVDEQPSRCEPRPPRGVELSAEGVAKLALDKRLDGAANDMMDDREARGGDGLKRRITHRQPRVEISKSYCLERQPIEPYDLHQQAVTHPQCVVVVLHQIGEMDTRRDFCPRGGATGGRH